MVCKFKNTFYIFQQDWICLWLQVFIFLTLCSIQIKCTFPSIKHSPKLVDRLWVMGIREPVALERWWSSFCSWHSSNFSNLWFICGMKISRQILTSKVRLIVKQILGFVQIRMFSFPSRWIVLNCGSMLRWVLRSVCMLVTQPPISLLYWIIECSLYI